MTTHADFIALAHKVATAARDQGLNLDTYQVIAFADALHQDGVLAASPLPAYGRWTFDQLEVAYRTDAEASQAMRETRRILAIKRIRFLSGCSLLDAKNASESPANRAAFPDTFHNWS